MMNNSKPKYIADLLLIKLLVPVEEVRGGEDEMRLSFIFRVIEKIYQCSKSCDAGLALPWCHLADPSGMLLNGKELGDGELLIVGY